MTMTSCRACGAQIFFIKTKKGTSVPVDAEQVFFIPGPAGKELFVMPDGTTEHGFKMNIQGDATKVGYISHFATCPEADKFRKPRKSTRKNG